MNRIIFFCFLSGFYLQLYSQNLVYNPSFEEITVCPTNLGYISAAKGWISPNGHIAWADLHNNCLDTSLYTLSQYWCRTDTNYMGSQTPLDGDTYGGAEFAANSPGAINQYARRFFEGRTTVPLNSGTTYHMSFYLSLGDICSYSMSNIGVYFSIDSLYVNDTLGKLVPQIQNSLSNFIDNKTGWTKIEGDYTATGGEKFFTIGNFGDSTNTTFEYIEPGHPSYAYYYIDCVCIAENQSTCTCGSSNSIKEDYEVSFLETYPNPANSTVTVKLSKPAPIFMYNLLGGLVCSFPVQENLTMDVSSIPDGIYLLKSDGKTEKIIILH